VQSGLKQSADFKSIRVGFNADRNVAVANRLDPLIKISVADQNIVHSAAIDIPALCGEFQESRIDEKLFVLIGLARACAHGAGSRLGVKFPTMIERDVTDLLARLKDGLEDVLQFSGSSGGGLGSFDERFHHGSEDDQAVLGIESGFDSAFGMRHQTGHVAFTIADTGDIGCGAVWIACGIVISCRRGVTEQDLMILLEFGKRGIVTRVIAVAVGDGNFQNLARLCGARERGMGVFDSNVNVAADEAEAGVAHHGSGKKAGFEENLEAVADAEDKAAGFSEFCDGVHDRRKACNGAGAEVVSVRKAAGKQDGVTIVEIFRLMPDEFDRLLQNMADRVKRVVIAVGPGENHYTKFHGTPPGGFAGKLILAQRGEKERERRRFIFALIPPLLSPRRRTAARKRRVGLLRSG